MVDVEWYEKKRAGRDIEIATSGVTTRRSEMPPYTSP